MTDDSRFRTLLRLRARPGHWDEVIGMISDVAAVSAAQSGCLNFEVYTTRTPSEIWVHEAYISKGYHDETHEALPEVRRLVERLPAHLSEPWTIVELRPVSGDAYGSQRPAITVSP